ncbi:MAG: FAD-dependent oxidoreductase, partial [Candidatus Eisenbacteria bacterium]|nr:FAD-dependent oxidoreductase [Candidatus Eisenbacteria bacterium]
MAETTDFTKLRASLVGELLLPADPGYDGARAIWNAMIDRRPAAIARCLGASDVMECFRFARSTGIPFSIRGGGHNIAGLSLVDDGLLIDLSRMRGVHVRPAEGIAHAQAGCVLGDVDRET